MNQDETEGKSETTLKKQTGVTVNYFFNGSGCRIMIPIAIGNQHSRKPWPLGAITQLL